MLEEKSSGARNDYLLSLAAANAHQTRYFLVDLQNIMNVSELKIAYCKNAYMLYF